jgi:arylformamidase
MTGRAYVLTYQVDITASVLERSQIPPRTRRVLFKTRNSTYWKNNENQFQTDFVALSADGADYLIRRGSWWGRLLCSPRPKPPHHEIFLGGCGF